MANPWDTSFWYLRGAVCLRHVPALPHFAAFDALEATKCAEVSQADLAQRAELEKPKPKPKTSGKSKGKDADTETDKAVESVKRALGHASYLAAFAYASMGGWAQAKEHSDSALSHVPSLSVCPADSSGHAHQAQIIALQRLVRAQIKISEDNVAEAKSKNLEPDPMLSGRALYPQSLASRRKVTVTLAVKHNAAFFTELAASLSTSVSGSGSPSVSAPASASAYAPSVAASPSASVSVSAAATAPSVVASPSASAPAAAASGPISAAPTTAPPPVSAAPTPIAGPAGPRVQIRDTPYGGRAMFAARDFAQVSCP